MVEVASAWKLESFIDSLIVELDRARDTLSIKGLTRKTTYAVKDVSFDLHVFPQYHQGDLKFNVARPGEEGSSRIAFQLGSITDRQITETTNSPISEDDISIDELVDIEPELKQELQKIGVTSASDVDRLKSRKVNLGAVVDRKSDGNNKISYSDLAGRINSARRNRSRPEVSNMSVTPHENGGYAISLSGSNLAPQDNQHQFPAAVLNETPAEIEHTSDEELVIIVPENAIQSGENSLAVALDPYAVLQLNIQKGQLQ